MTKPVSLTGVDYGYSGQDVLRDITVEIDRGAFLGVIGPNGSGKTTLLEIMLGLRSPDQGEALLFGTSATDFADGTRLGYVSQSATRSSASMPISVREVVRMGRYAHVGLGRLREEDHTAVDDALARVDLEEQADRSLSTLSGGQRQRVFVARALASEAELLVLDEPTVGIDFDAVEEIYDILTTLNASGITIILVEHDIAQLADHASELVCLNGTIHAQGPTESVLEDDVIEQTFRSTRLRSLAGEA